MNLNFKAMVDSFQLTGDYYGKTDRVMKKMLELTASGELTRRKGDFKFEWKQKGVTIELVTDYSGLVTTIDIFVDLSSLLRDTQPTLTELTPALIEQAESMVLDLLRRTGILALDHSIQWKMNPVLLSQDFYTDSDPGLLTKIIGYCVNLREDRKLYKKEYFHEPYEDSETNTIGFQYHGGYHELRNIQEEENLVRKSIPEERLQLAQHRVQYAIICCRDKLDEFERKHFDLRTACKLRNGFIARYLTRMSEAAPKILHDEIVSYFGSYSFGTADTVRERMKSFSERAGIYFEPEIKELVENYLTVVNTKDIPGILNYLQNLEPQAIDALGATMQKLALNSFVIPDDILEPTEQKCFPYPSLELLLQGGTLNANTNRA